ncbi:MAG: PA0069 family radical SAM protein [Pseudomonadota bacterium]
MARAAHLSLRPPRPGEAQKSANGPGEKGRGARTNVSGRYETEQRISEKDGWDFDIRKDEGGDRLGEPAPSGGAENVNAAPPLVTDVSIERPRKIITYNKSPFVGFDRSINPYRGCEHGCAYCFARPTHAYMGLSPGLDFESKLFAKPNAAALLENELSARNYKVRPVAMGTNTDPYQPIERKFQIMPGILSTFLRFRHPVTVLTKSHLITRDIKLLSQLADWNLARAMLSITTLDRMLARHMEPRASTPENRLNAVRQLKEAGIPVGVMAAPMIPGLNDDELETLLDAAKDAGADFVGYTIIRLPLEVSPLFQEWLETFAPNRARRVMGHIRDMNGGKDYDVHWSRGREVKSTYAKLIAARFSNAVRRLGLRTKGPILSVDQFAAPAAASAQLGLFDRD